MSRYMRTSDHRQNVYNSYNSQNFSNGSKNSFTRPRQSTPYHRKSSSKGSNRIKNDSSKINQKNRSNFKEKFQDRQNEEGQMKDKEDYQMGWKHRKNRKFKRGRSFQSQRFEKSQSCEIKNQNLDRTYAHNENDSDEDMNPHQQRRLNHRKDRNTSFNNRNRKDRDDFPTLSNTQHDTLKYKKCQKVIQNIQQIDYKLPFEKLRMKFFECIDQYIGIKRFGQTYPINFVGRLILRNGIFHEMWSKVLLKNPKIIKNIFFPRYYNHHKEFIKVNYSSFEQAFNEIQTDDEDRANYEQAEKLKRFRQSVDQTTNMSHKMNVLILYEEVKRDYAKIQKQARKTQKISAEEKFRRQRENQREKQKERERQMEKEKERESERNKQREREKQRQQEQIEQTIEEIPKLSQSFSSQINKQQSIPHQSKTQHQDQLEKIVKQRVEHYSLISARDEQRYEKNGGEYFENDDNDEDQNFDNENQLEISFVDERTATGLNDSEDDQLESLQMGQIDSSQKLSKKPLSKNTYKHKQIQIDQQSEYHPNNKGITKRQKSPESKRPRFLYHFQTNQRRRALEMACVFWNVEESYTLDCIQIAQILQCHSNQQMQIFVLRVFTNQFIKLIGKMGMEAKLKTVAAVYKFQSLQQLIRIEQAYGKIDGIVVYNQNLDFKKYLESYKENHIMLEDYKQQQKQIKGTPICSKDIESIGCQRK